MDDLQTADTAPHDGTLFWGTHNRLGEFAPLRKMFWGVGKPHTVTADNGKTIHGYIVNGGDPWWLNEDGLKMAPSPTHWKPIASKEGRADDAE